MAASSQNESSVGLRTGLGSFVDLVGIYTSPSRGEIFVLHADGIFSFVPAQGQSGIYHHIAGVKRYPATSWESWHRDGDAASAEFGFGTSNSLVEDSEGHLFVTDASTRSIRKIDLTASKVSTFFGNPKFRNGLWKIPILKDPSHEIAAPTGVLFDDDRNLVVVDGGTHRVIRIIKDTGYVETLAGQFKKAGFQDGPPTVSLMLRPYSAVLAPGLGFIVTDTGNHVLRLVTMGRETRTWAGTGKEGTADGPVQKATFAAPKAIIMNHYGDIIVAEPTSKRLRIIKNGMVTTLLRPKMFPGVNSHPAIITGIAATESGNILIASKNGLFELLLGSSLKERWINAGRGSHRSVEFQSAIGLAQNDQSLLHRLTGEFSLEFTPYGRRIYIPRAFLMVRCKPLVEDEECMARLKSADIPAELIDIFVSYLLSDTLPSFSDPSCLSHLIYLSFLAHHCKLLALKEHVGWQTSVLLMHPQSASNLATALKASISTIQEDLITMCMKSIVTHNLMFSQPEAIELLKSSALPPWNEKLKAMLKADDRLLTVRNRCRPAETVFGNLIGQMSTLLRASLDGKSIYSDLALVVSKDGQRFAIPVHSFVLYPRWSYIRPLLKHGFREATTGEVELCKPDGKLFEFTWTSTFLTFLYTGNIVGFFNKTHAATLVELADYLALRETEDDVSNHEWLVSRLETYLASGEGWVHVREVVVVNSTTQDDGE